MSLFDTHAHLTDRQLVADLPGVLQRAATAGVSHIMAVGTTGLSSQECVKLAHAHDAIYAAVGIQPNHCLEAGPTDWDEVLRLTSDPRVRAIGETGLDRYWNDSPFDLQRDYFDRHLRLSQHLDRAFIVHMRDCGEDVLAMLREAHERGRLRGVMHSFTGDLALMRACVELGLYISFAGMVTFKKSADLREIAAEVPADRLLLETDSPYLSPDPFRGQRPNEPARVVHTARCLAEVRGVPCDQLASQTTVNARRLFGLE